MQSGRQTRVNACNTRRYFLDASVGHSRQIIRALQGDCRCARAACSHVIHRHCVLIDTARSARSPPVTSYSPIRTHRHTTRTPLPSARCSLVSTLTVFVGSITVCELSSPSSLRCGHASRHTYIDDGHFSRTRLHTPVLREALGKSYQLPPSRGSWYEMLALFAYAHLLPHTVHSKQSEHTPPNGGSPDATAHKHPSGAVLIC